MKILIDKRILEIEQKQALYTGNINSYVVDIEFVNDIYDDYLVYIVFKNCSIKKKVLVQCNKVIIPSEVLKEPGDLIVGFFAVKNDNEKVIIYSSNIEMVSITNGGYDEEATYTEEITPTILEQYLQEMKEFYNESIKEYNDNALLETNKFNTNADNRKKEIDALALNIEEDKKAVEKIQEKVELSEQNAKESADNAKTSEQNAQNSANKALESESNITAIQEDINASKSHIDEQKGKVDKSVDDVEKLVEEATIQANISKEQAELSTTKAGQVSADKNAVESMKNEVSSMKTSVEQTKADAEQIKEETEQAKNETLEAKEIVKNSLENERIESDKRYARAIESEEIVVDGEGQVELDEEGFMKDVSIESNLPEITQKVREGYNKVKGFISEGSYNGTLENDVFKSVELNGYGNARTRFEPIILEAQKEYFASVECRALNNSYNNSIIILLYYRTGESEYRTKSGTIVSNPSVTGTYNKTIVKFQIEEELEVSGFLIQTNNAENALIEVIKPMISEENLDYEEYGVSPSLEYPSDFKNIVKNVDIGILKDNLSNFPTESTGAISGTSWCGLKFEIINNYTSKISGKPTADEYRVGGYYNSTEVLIPIDYKKNYYVYNNLDLRMSVTLVQKDGTYRQHSFNNKEALDLTENDIGISSLRISVSTNIEYKDTILRYIVCEEIDEKTISLLEDQFLGKFNGYENYIENNKLKGNLKVYTITGDEDWNIEINENYLKTPSESVDFCCTTLYSSILPNSKLLCNAFENKLFDGEYRKSDNIESISSGGSYRRIYIRIRKERLESIDNAGIKKLLKELYETGTPIKILYVTNEQYEYELSLENKFKINTLRVYKGINNIYSNCKIRFKANKNLNKHIESRIKETVANEREISDSKYSRALKGIVEDTNFTQIYADNSKIDNLVIKGSQLKQETHTSTANILYSEEKYWEIGSLESTTGQPMENNTRLRTKEFIPLEEQEDYFASTENSNYVWLNIHYYNSKKEFITTQQTITDNVNGNTNVSILPPQGTKYLKAIIRKTDNGEMNLPDVSIAKTMIVKGTSKIDYIEGYPIMPSLDYPSETDLTTEQNIQDSQENILYIDNSDYKPGYTITSAGITFTVQDDLGLKCVGTATSNTKVNILGIYANRFEEKLNIPKGQKIYGYITGEKVTGARIVLFSNNKYTVLTSTNSYIFQESTPIGQVYAEVVTNSIVDCVVYPQITYEKVDKFYPYIGYRKNISLPPNEFNNGIGEYKNKIKKIDGKWCLVKYIKELILDGTENLSVGYPTITSNNFQTYSLSVEGIVDTWRTGKGLMSNSFLNVTGNTVYNKSGEGICSDDKGRLIICTNILNLDEFKVKLKEKYDAGEPVKIYYATTKPKIIEPSEEAQNTLNSIELMYDLNNISIDNGTMSFEYSKSLARAFEEEQEKNANMQAQIDQIMSLLSTPSTASLLAENLAKDNESEVI